jgi:hypothetical protein
MFEPIVLVVVFVELFASFKVAIEFVALLVFFVFANRFFLLRRFVLRGCRFGRLSAEIDIPSHLLFFYEKESLFITRWRITAV